MWFRDCAGRARGDASSAGAAAITRGWVRRQFDCGEYLRQKEPRPELGVDEHGALTVPANPGRGGVVSLQYRTGIDVTFLDAAGFAQEVVERSKLRCDHIMIVIAPRVTSNATRCRAVHPRVRGSLPIVHRQDDD